MPVHRSVTPTAGSSSGRPARPHALVLQVTTAAAVVLLSLLVLSPGLCRARSAFIVTSRPQERQRQSSGRAIVTAHDDPHPHHLLLITQGHASTTASTNRWQRRMATTSAGTTNVGQDIEVVRQPDDEFLLRRGVFDWGTWGCGISTFPWTYDESESCYLLAGRVTVTPTDGRQPATFGKGDFVTFPAGMSCTWDGTEAVKKHYMFF